MIQDRRFRTIPRRKIVAQPAQHAPISGILVYIFDRFIVWPLLIFCHLLVSSLLAWHVLAQIDFAYPVGYAVLDIDETIEEFGPRNRYRSDFGKTEREQHYRLFGAIVDGIQNEGAGLAEIRYPLADGSRATLLRDPEREHLQDVARIVNHFYLAGFMAGVLLTGLLIYSFRRHQRPPKPRRILSTFGALLALGALALWAIGPVRVFYWFHLYAFPADKPWYFYYEDSLMTTLMKAPDLFGFIGALLLVLTLLIWSSSGALLWRALKRG